MRKRMKQRQVIKKMDNPITECRQSKDRDRQNAIYKKIVTLCPPIFFYFYSLISCLIPCSWLKVLTDSYSRLDNESMWCAEVFEKLGSKNFGTRSSHAAWNALPAPEMELGQWDWPETRDPTPPGTPVTRDPDWPGDPVPSLACTLPWYRRSG